MPLASYALATMVALAVLVAGAEAIPTRTTSTSKSEPSLSNDRSETCSLGLSASHAAASQSASHPSMTSTSSIDQTSTGTARRTLTPSADGTLSGTTSWSVSAASTTFVVTQTVRLTPTRVSPSTSRASISAVATLSRTPTRLLTAASLSTTVDRQSTSILPSVSTSMVPSVSLSIAKATASNVASPSADVLPTASRSGVFLWEKGQVGDRSYSATRSPSAGNDNPPWGRSTTMSLRPTQTPSPSPTASATHTRSWTSSNFLPGLGANNPLLWYRVTYAYFDDPSMCSPDVLMVLFAPTGWFLVVCVVWAIASRCGSRDPNERCIPEKYTLRAGRTRFMVSHHAYASCVVPCHLRCAPLHALELLSHMSVSLLLLIGFGIAMAEGNTPPSISLTELVCLGLCAVLVATAVRALTSRVGWLQGRRATVARRRPAAAENGTDSRAGGIVAHGVVAGSSSSDDEATFPKAYMAKSKRKRHKDIGDYVVSYISRRAEGDDDASSEEEDGVRDDTQRRNDGVVDLRPEEHDEWDPETDSWFRQEEGRLHEQSKHAPVAPPPDWLFNVDDVDDGPDAHAMTELVSEQFQKLSVRVPKSHTSTIFADDGLDLQQVPVGPNYMRRAVALHVCIWLGAFGGAVGLAVDLERAVGRNGCSDLPTALAIVFVGWDALLLQSLFAAWKGWRQRAWECCCDVEIDTGCAGHDDAGGDLREAEELRTEFALHPLF